MYYLKTPNGIKKIIMKKLFTLLLIFTTLNVAMSQDLEINSVTGGIQFEVVSTGMTYSYTNSSSLYAFINQDDKVKFFNKLGGQILGSFLYSTIEVNDTIYATPELLLAALQELDAFNPNGNCNVILNCSDCGGGGTSLWYLEDDTLKTLTEKVQINNLYLEKPPTCSIEDSLVLNDLYFGNVINSLGMGQGVDYSSNVNVSNQVSQDNLFDTISAINDFFEYSVGFDYGGCSCSVDSLQYGMRYDFEEIDGGGGLVLLINNEVYPIAGNPFIGHDDSLAWSSNILAATLPIDVDINSISLAFIWNAQSMEVNVNNMFVNLYGKNCETKQMFLSIDENGLIFPTTISGGGGTDGNGIYSGSGVLSEQTTVDGGENSLYFNQIDELSFDASDVSVTSNSDVFFNAQNEMNINSIQDVNIIANNKLKMQSQFDVDLNAQNGDVYLYADDSVKIETRVGPLDINVREDVNIKNVTGKMDVFIRDDIELETETGKIELIGRDSVNLKADANGVVNVDAGGFNVETPNGANFDVGSTFNTRITLDATYVHLPTLQGDNNQFSVLQNHGSGSLIFNKVTSQSTTGASGTFTSNDGKTITVTNGLITNIAP